MRNRLVIVGNGLDLALGLKTSYEDFLLFYARDYVLDALSKVDEEWCNSNRTHLNGKDFSFEFKGQNKRMSLTWRGKFIDNYNKIVEGVKNCSEFRELINLLEKDYLMAFQFSFPFFNNLVKSSKLKGWCDIEREYYNGLISRYEKGNPIDVYNEAFEKIKSMLNSYIKKENDQLKNDTAKNSFVRLFLAGLFYENLSSGNRVKRLGILNFNYTSTVDSNFTESLSERSINLSIHGKAEEPDSVIFGYGDDVTDGYKSLEESNEDEFIKHFKTHYYSQSMNYEKLISFLDERHYEVLVIGHSCGLSDRTMLKEIFEHDHCDQIRIFHHKESEKDARDVHFSIDLAISRHFDDKQKKRRRVKPFDEKLKIPQYKPSKV